MASKKMMTSVACSLSSTVTLNDGVVMPMFGLGMYLTKSGKGGEAEKAVNYALQNGYKMIDTAEFYGNEADVGKGIMDSGVRREEVFIVTKLWDHGHDTCLKSFKTSLKKLDIGFVDLYLMHSPGGGKIIETYDTMLELKNQGLVRSVGVSNFGVHHLEGLAKAGKPLPSVNQIELHPWQQKEDIVKYCLDHGITVMGYSPLTKGQRLNDPDIINMASKYDKTAAQLLIRWSVQKGYITIPKSSSPERISENAQVFDYSISEDDMNTLNAFQTWSCTWDPTTCPWEG